MGTPYSGNPFTGAPDPFAAGGQQALPDQPFGGVGSQNPFVPAPAPRSPQQARRRPAGVRLPQRQARRPPTPNPVVPGTRPRDRTGRLSRTALVAAIACPLLLGVAIYLALDSIDVLSLHPVAAAIGWGIVALVLALLLPVIVVMALVAVAKDRPRGTALAALVLVVVLPFLTVWASIGLGVDAARRHAEAALAIDGGVLDRTSDLAVSWGVDAGPVRDVIKAVLEGDTR